MKRIIASLIMAALLLLPGLAAAQAPAGPQASPPAQPEHPATPPAAAPQAPRRSPAMPDGAGWDLHHAGR